LQQIADGYASRERFLTELTLDPPDATSGHARATQRDEDYTILSTIHSAKGGEWEIVRVLNVVDGCIPSARATRTADEIEEERRLLHVAMTRAKDELDLIVPHRLFMYQQNGHDSGHVYAKMSRFIPESIHHAFELRQWRERRRNSTATESKSHSRGIDVAASAEQMWRQKPEG
jgi:ATP-dependent DNA helicase UvrD/PcrA